MKIYKIKNSIMLPFPLVPSVICANVLSKSDKIAIMRLFFIIFAKKFLEYSLQTIPITLSQPYNLSHDTLPVSPLTLVL